MEFPHYGYSGVGSSPSPPDDPESSDPNWKDITDRCKPLVDELLAKAEKLFGQRTAELPIRVAESTESPRISVINGVASIRVSPGVSSNDGELRSQIAHEIVHMLSGDVPNTFLEEGLCVYFQVNDGGGFPPYASDPNQE